MTQTMRDARGSAPERQRVHTARAPRSKHAPNCASSRRRASRQLAERLSTPPDLLDDLSTPSAGPSLAYFPKAEEPMRKILFALIAMTAACADNSTPGDDNGGDNGGGAGGGGSGSGSGSGS